jgi:hypothetical protein
LTGFDGFGPAVEEFSFLASREEDPALIEVDKIRAVNEAESCAPGIVPTQLATRLVRQGKLSASDSRLDGAFAAGVMSLLHKRVLPGRKVPATSRPGPLGEIHASLASSLISKFD